MDNMTKTSQGAKGSSKSRKNQNMIKLKNMAIIKEKLREFEKKKLSEFKTTVWLDNLRTGAGLKEFNLDFSKFQKGFVSIKVYEKNLFHQFEGSQVGTNDSEIDMNMSHN
jgi:hypothetical protein